MTRSDITTGDYITKRGAMGALSRLDARGGAIASSDWTSGHGRWIARLPMPPHCATVTADTARTLGGQVGRAARRLLRDRPRVRRLVVIGDLRQARRALRAWAARPDGSDTADGWKPFSAATIGKIDYFADTGWRIIVGNDPALGRRPMYAGQECRRLALTNSRRHGFSVRTVWAVRPACDSAGIYDLIVRLCADLANNGHVGEAQVIRRSLDACDDQE